MGSNNNHQQHFYSAALLQGFTVFSSTYINYPSYKYPNCSAEEALNTEITLLTPLQDLSSQPLPTVGHSDTGAEMQTHVPAPRVPRSPVAQARPHGRQPAAPRYPLLPPAARREPAPAKKRSRSSSLPSRGAFAASLNQCPAGHGAAGRGVWERSRTQAGG